DEVARRNGRTDQVVEIIGHVLRDVPSWKDRARGVMLWAMTKRVLADYREYRSAELADRYKSTAGSQEAVEADVTARELGVVERRGYVVIENLLAKDKVEEIRRDVVPRFEFDSGRNNFEGFATQRLYGVLAKTFVCNELVEHPRILAIVDRLLEPNYLLS